MLQPFLFVPTNSFMNAISPRAVLGSFVVSWLCLISAPITALAAPGDPQPEYQPAPDEFTPLANAVLELLKTGDAARFATNFAATADDYRSIVPTNLPPAEAKGFLDSCLRSVEGPRRELESQAKALVERAAKLKLVFFKRQLPGPRG
jgi:hypothetical protein